MLHNQAEQHFQKCSYKRAEGIPAFKQISGAVGELADKLTANNLLGSQIKGEKMFPKVSITNNFSSDFYTCENPDMLKGFQNVCQELYDVRFYALGFIGACWTHSAKNNSASAAGLVQMALKASVYGSLMRPLAGLREDRQTAAGTEEMKWDSIKFMFIKIGGHHKNQKDADKSKGLST